MPSKRAWAASLGIPYTPLLPDFWLHGKVAQQHGIFRGANGFSERAKIIQVVEQTAVFVKVYPA